METKEELLRIIDLFNDTYESEEAWHGPSVVGVLRDVSPKLSNRRLSPELHTIAELVYHITTWRIFAVKRLQGSTESIELTRKKNWKTFPQVDELEWETLQMELSLSQEELISELEKKESDEFLDNDVPGRNYTFYTLLHGIIQHDLYHAGQMAIIKKALKRSINEEENLEDFEGSAIFDDNYDDLN